MTDNTFLQMANVKGPITTPGFKDSVRVQTVDFSLFRPLSASGQAGIRKAGRVIPGPFCFTKQADMSSTYLFKEATVGKAEEVVAYMTSTLGNKTVAIRQIELFFATIINLAITIQAARAIESVSLRYGELQDTSRKTDDAGKILASKSVRYSIQESIKM